MVCLYRLAEVFRVIYRMSIRISPCSQCEGKRIIVQIFADAIRPVKEIHGKFFGIKSICRDVVMCQDGPVLI